MSKADRFEVLDALLAAANADSMDWADGGDRGAAEAALKGFAGADWARLAAEWRGRGQNWRLCLVQILHPEQSPAADAPLELAFDPDSEVAFEALRQMLTIAGSTRPHGVPSATPVSSTDRSWSGRGARSTCAYGQTRAAPNAPNGSENSFGC